MGTNKYRNRKTTVDGITFDSKLESEYYTHLKKLKMAGIVDSYELQPKYELLAKFKHEGKTVLPITYKADFLVKYKDGRTEVVDVKGVFTEVFKIKRKLFHHRYPEMKLILVKSHTKKDGWKTH